MEALEAREHNVCRLHAGEKPHMYKHICIYLGELGNMGKNKNIYTGLVIIKSTVLCSNIEKVTKKSQNQEFFGKVMIIIMQVFPLYKKGWGSIQG